MQMQIFGIVIVVAIIAVAIWHVLGQPVPLILFMREPVDINDGILDHFKVSATYGEPTDGWVFLWQVKGCKVWLVCVNPLTGYQYGSFGNIR